MFNEFSIFFKNPKPKRQRVKTELTLEVWLCYRSHIVLNFLVPNKNCASRSSGKLGELFQVQEDGSKLRLEDSCISNSHYGGCTNFFAGWITRFGKPIFIFVFPLSEIDIRTSESNHHKISFLLCAALSSIWSIVAVDEPTDNAHRTG
jgi:hypothetical protein